MATEIVQGGPPPPFQPALRWSLHPRVAVRPERFGALLYHFGTRRLSFLKDLRLLAVVTSLADHPSASAACDAAGVGPSERRAFDAALARLAGSDMLVRADMPGIGGTPAPTGMEDQRR